MVRLPEARGPADDMQSEMSYMVKVDDGASSGTYMGKGSDMQSQGTYMGKVGTGSLM